ncbi:MAG: hypothetical protein ACK5IP_15660 [Paracoccus sp. (in: a-proteobacteria)]
MKPFYRRLAAVAALAFACVSPAAAQTASPSPGFFSADNLIGGLTRAVISYSRMIADIRYGSLAVDGGRGSLVLRDLKIAGLGQYDACRVSLDRLQVSGISLLAQEEAATRLDLAGLSVATRCFGMNGAMIAAVIDDDAIRLDTVALDLTQSAGSGALTVNLEAIAPGLARIEGGADFDYFSFIIPDFFEQIAAGGSDDTPADPMAQNAGEPAMGARGTLSAAHLSLEDLGGWQKIRPILPPGATGPEALAALVNAEPGTPSHRFQQALAGALEAFIARPGRITAEIRPAAPLNFDSSGWNSPDQALALFQPVFSNAAPTPPLALIADPENGADPRALGLALAKGAGLPQNTRRAIELLTPLQQDGEVALALAGLKTATDPGAAYGHAIEAARLGAPGAKAAMDRIEARLTAEQLFAAQPGAETPLPEDAFASLVRIRDAALAHEQGDGVPRSYALALRLAGSAAAAGDGPARALLARLESRFAGDPAWAELRAAAADQALADWRRLGLAQRLGTGAD